VEDTKNLWNRSSVRLLETGSGSFTSELLGFASSGIGDKEGLVVLDEEFLELTLLRLISEFLVEGDETLADSLTDGHNLGSGTSTSNADSDVEAGEAFGTEEEDGLVDLHSHGLGLEELKSLSVDTDVASSASSVLDVGDSGGVLLSAEALDLVLFCGHFSLCIGMYYLVTTSTKSAY